MIIAIRKALEKKNGIQTKNNIFQQSIMEKGICKSGLNRNIYLDKKTSLNIRGHLFEVLLTTCWISQMYSSWRLFIQTLKGFKHVFTKIFQRVPIFFFIYSIQSVYFFAIHCGLNTFFASKDFHSGKWFLCEFLAKTDCSRLFSSKTVEGNLFKMVFHRLP